MSLKDDVAQHKLVVLVLYVGDISILPLVIVYNGNSDLQAGYNDGAGFERRRNQNPNAEKVL